MFCFRQTDFDRRLQKSSGLQGRNQKFWVGDETLKASRGWDWEGVIGVDLAGLLGGRMASAEGGSVPSGVEYGEGCPLSSRLSGLGERRELPQRGPGQSPGRKRILAVFWRPQNAYFCTYMTKSAGTICISVPRSKFWGGEGLVPLFPRWSTPMEGGVLLPMRMASGDGAMRSPENF